MDQTIRILIIDGYPVVKHMLKMQIELEPDLLVVGEADAALPSVDLVAQLEPDVILVDLDTPRGTAKITAQEIRSALPRIPMLILSLNDDEAYHKLAANIGAASFILKQGDSASLVEAIRKAANRSL